MLLVPEAIMETVWTAVCLVHVPAETDKQKGEFSKSQVWLYKEDVFLLPCKLSFT